MSIFNDDRRYSDDPDDYRAWRSELDRELRKANYVEDRDCENCKHYVIQNEGLTEALFGKLYGCELWECNYKGKTDECNS